MPLDLNRFFLKEGHELNFFQAVYLLEKLFPAAGRHGTGDDMTSEPVRFETLNTLAFPSSDVHSVLPPRSLQQQAERNADGKEDEPDERIATTPLARMPKEGRGPLRMSLTFMGLYGVSSPLPSYFVDPITLRKVEYFELKKFLDIFTHRLYSLFYRSWKKYRHYAQFRPDLPDDYTLRLLALTGQWPHRSKVRMAGESSDFNLRRIPYARYLGNRVRSAKGLEQLLRGYFGFKRVKVRQFTPAWVDIPMKTQLGLGGTALGVSARIGDRMLDRVSRFTVEIGPLERPVFNGFLPTSEAVMAVFRKPKEEPGNDPDRGAKGPGRNGAAKAPDLLEQVRELIDAYLRDPIDYEVKVLLEPEAGVLPALGTDHARMGMGIWLGEAPAQEIACKL
jgi:type VI secretion system protein ImpH